MKAKQEELYARQQGTGQPHVYRKHIVDFPVPKPSLSEQWEKIGEARDVISQRVDMERQEIDELEQAVAGVEELYNEDEREKPKVYKADYQGATPKEVAKALLKFQPKGRK